MAFFHQAGDHASLAGAEIGFAVGFEDFRHAPVGSAFDFLVDIDEIAIEHCRQPPADSRFAHAHQSDQYHGAVDPPGEPADFGGGKAGCMGHCRSA